MTDSTGPAPDIPGEIGAPVRTMVSGGLRALGNRVPRSLCLLCRSRLGDMFKMPNPSDPEPVGGVEAAREVVACAERTLAAPSARIELRQELGLEWPRAPGWRGGVLRLAVKTGGLLVRAWWWLATRRGPNRGLA